MEAGHDSFTNPPWILKLVEFTQKVLAQDRVRIIGVCFGHQIVGRAMGVEVGRNKDGWEAAVNDVELTEKGKEVFGVEVLVSSPSINSFLGQISGRRREVLTQNEQSLHQMHRDVVFAYPKGVEELGSSPVCSVQGMYSPRRLITVQGHPEFNEEIMTEIIETRHQTGIFDDEVYRQYMEMVPKKHDGLVVSRAFLTFLMDA
jgi:GMP synthase-like glutamine amidotransferase